MTIKCPYCKNEVQTFIGKLTDHLVITGRPFSGFCIGSGEYIDKARELNEAHERTREAVRRVR